MGPHIKGLIITLFQTLWPSLLQIPGFLQEFVTPIVKVSRGRLTQSFFTMPEYETWRQDNGDGRGWVAKYYKGLGTSSAAEAKEYFSQLKKHSIEFDYVPERDDPRLHVAFSQDKRASGRCY